MAVHKNQFSAKIRFDPIAWRAYDEETGASAAVQYESGRFKWAVTFSNRYYAGSSKTAGGARAACRRAIAKHGSKKN